VSFAQREVPFTESTSSSPVVVIPTPWMFAVIFEPPTEPSLIERDTSLGSVTRVAFETIAWFSGIPISKYSLAEERLVLVRLVSLKETRVAENS
jgi:hypothetical protein